jgi:5'-nucleotidase
MNFLLTNDDGIAAPGLWTAARVLADIGSVLIVAPATNYSGYGAALPPARSLSCVSYHRHSEQLPNVTAFALSATPATCVQVGLSNALSRQPIDMVVSGVNDTANLGRDVLYSGTVGAALTAHILGVPALAMSLDFGQTGVAHWDTAAWAVREVIATWRDRPEPLLLNVNVPNLPLAMLQGVVQTSLNNATCLTQCEFRADPHVEDRLTVVRRSDVRDRATEPWTDAWAVAHGYLSITPLRLFPDLLCMVPWGEAMMAPSMPMLADAAMN